ncbi:MAG: hypothetical protein K2N30_03030 [Clostridia bacterium]|nr:hypothetical protein [Clostridia bacterium]
MDYKGVLSALDGLSKRGINFGLERTRALLDGLGSPDKKLKIVHIAGTNGKGSTAEYVGNVLTAAGKKTGIFTSPEVYGYLAQFRIDGENISKELFCEGFSRALDLAETAYGEATRFEVETAAALYCFYLAGCGYAVVECGLGGRYDATNAISGKEIALITSISLEHTAVLGGDIPSICSHKAGIIKNCPAIISGCVKGEAREYFKRLGADFAEKLDLSGYNVNLSEAQAYNAGLAAAAARALKIDENAIYSGVCNAKPAGRVEVIRRGATYILDGAHNPEAFAPLCEYLKNIEKDNLTVIFGCLADKDIGGNLRALSEVADCIIAVECPSPRALPLEKTLEECKKYFRYCGSAPSVAEAIIKTETAFVAVCGSFTLLKEAKNWIEKE